MQSRPYCVYNETNECFLSLGTRLGHNPFAFLRRLTGKNAELLHDAFWLTPLSRVKTLGMLRSHDLVYLDDQQTAVGVIESFLMPRVAPQQDEARSLLVLPERTISASQTRIGNQLVICSPEVMEGRLRKTAEEAAHNLETTGEIAIRGEGRAEALNVMLTARAKSCPVTKTCFESSFSAPSEIEEDLGPNRKETSMSAMQHLHFGNRFPERRGSARSGAPTLFANYRIRGSIAAKTVRDISVSGLYLVTDERWPLGTRLTMTLELVEPRTSARVDSVPVHLKVTRWGPDGLGLEFVSSQKNLVEMERDNLLLIRAAHGEESGHRVKPVRGAQILAPSNVLRLMFITARTRRSCDCVWRTMCAKLGSR